MQLCSACMLCTGVGEGVAHPCLLNEREEKLERGSKMPPLPSIQACISL